MITSSVIFGANRPNHPSYLRSGMPDSIAVGMSGAPLNRLSVVTAKVVSFDQRRDRLRKLHSQRYAAIVNGTRDRRDDHGLRAKPESPPRFCGMLPCAGQTAARTA